MRKPDAGNPHVRFEEGEGTRRSLAKAFHSVRPSLLYCLEWFPHAVRGQLARALGKTRISPIPTNEVHQIRANSCNSCLEWLSRFLSFSFVSIRNTMNESFRGLRKFFRQVAFPRRPGFDKRLLPTKHAKRRRNFRWIIPLWPVSYLSCVLCARFFNHPCYQRNQRLKLWLRLCRSWVHSWFPAA
jgi:hypothetical protein